MSVPSDYNVPSDFITPLGAGIVPIRGEARTTLYPACVQGHRTLMEEAVNRFVYVCPEPGCDFEISRKDWLDYLLRAGLT